MQDDHKRSILKGIIWRILATSTTMLLVYLFTESITISIEVGILETLIKIGLYYSHERFWNHVGWGRQEAIINTHSQASDKQL